MTQQASNLSFTGVFERMRFLIHDRDSKFTAAFDEVFSQRRHQSHPHPNPCTPSERLRRALRPHRPVRVSRRLLILDRRHLESVLRVYTEHYDRKDVLRWQDEDDLSRGERSFELVCLRMMTNALWTRRKALTQTPVETSSCEVSSSIPPHDPPRARRLTRAGFYASVLAAAAGRRGSALE